MNTSNDRLAVAFRDKEAAQQHFGGRVYAIEGDDPENPEVLLVEDKEGRVWVLCNTQGKQSTQRDLVNYNIYVSSKTDEKEAKDGLVLEHVASKDGEASKDNRKMAKDGLVLEHVASKDVEASRGNRYVLAGTTPKNVGGRGNAEKKTDIIEGKTEGEFRRNVSIRSDGTKRSMGDKDFRKASSRVWRKHEDRDQAIIDHPNDGVRYATQDEIDKLFEHGHVHARKERAEGNALVTSDDKNDPKISENTFGSKDSQTKLKKTIEKKCSEVRMKTPEEQKKSREWYKEPAWNRHQEAKGTNRPAKKPPSVRK